MPGLSALLIAALLLGSCDTAFDPFQENDYHFSVFGFLDDAADSQFIRITPVRDSIALTPGVVTNVDNDLGFLGGVSRKTMPWPALRGFLGAHSLPVCNAPRSPILRLVFEDTPCAAERGNKAPR